MTRREILDRIAEILRDVFDDDGMVVSENTSSENVEEWDSMNHINIIASIEIEFDVKFEIGMYTKLKKVSDIIDCIEGKI